MPYATNADLPPDVRGRFSGPCQTVFRTVWNDTFERHGDEGRAWATAESAGQACMESSKMKAALPTTPAAMREHLMMDPPDGHGMAEMDMPMAEMVAEHASMHDEGAGHTHMDTEKSDPMLKAFTPYEFKLSETGAMTVAFSRFNVVDSDGDVTFPGSLPVGKGVPMSAYGHTSWDGALPIGKGVVGERGDLGIFDGHFFMDTDQGRNAYATVKAMADLQEWSYGYNVVDGGPGTFDGKRVRELRKLDVFEVSPVLKGAGVGTATLAIKSGDPGSGLPYAEHLVWVLDEIEALSDRTKSRADWRAKEGRVMSAGNMARLEAIHERMRSMTDDLASMMAEMAPPPKMADPITMDVLLTEVRRLGVPI